MSINVSAVLFIRCRTAKQINRLQVYFDEESRYDFPEDAPKEEAEWVEPFEFLENPDGVKEIDKKNLLVEFYPEETDFTDEAKALIKTLVEIVGVESIIYCELGEDWTMFEYFSKDMHRLLWAVEGLDDKESDEKYNSFLSKEEKETYHALLYGKDYEKQDVEAVILKLIEKMKT